MNKNTLFVIAGQTGIGKTKIAHTLAKAIGAEIVLCDPYQAFRELKISSNKPPEAFVKDVKYHNLDIWSIKDETNAAMYSQRSRETIKDIWSRRKPVVLEGGSGFYMKMILTGGGLYLSDQEEKHFAEFKAEAARLIAEDANFETSLKRLQGLDSTFNTNEFALNDVYRLEKKLAEALMFGEGAYNYIKQREAEEREKNKLEGDIKKYFFFTEKLKITKILERRCEQMIQNGLMEEVSQLINLNLLNSKSDGLFINAFGLRETMEYFKEIQKNKDLQKKLFERKKDIFHKKIEEKFRNILWKYLKDFSITNRKYAKKQCTWFKHNDNFKIYKKEESFMEIEKIVEKILNDKLEESEYEQIDQQKTATYHPSFSFIKETNKDTMFEIFERTFKCLPNKKF